MINSDNLERFVLISTDSPSAVCWRRRRPCGQFVEHQRSGNILPTFPVSQWQWTIDAEAFRPSSDFAFVFFSAAWDLDQLDLASFLNTFHKLSTIFISQSSNFQNIQNLPALPSLTRLAITTSAGADCRFLPSWAQSAETSLTKWQPSWAIKSLSAASALEMLWLTTNQLRQTPIPRLVHFLS
jgi:hypothetical protein